MFCANDNAFALVAADEEDPVCNEFDSVKLRRRNRCWNHKTAKEGHQACHDGCSWPGAEASRFPSRKADTGDGRLEDEGDLHHDDNLSRLWNNKDRRDGPIDASFFR